MQKKLDKDLDSKVLALIPINSKQAFDCSLTNREISSSSAKKLLEADLSSTGDDLCSSEEGA